MMGRNGLYLEHMRTRESSELLTFQHVVIVIMVIIVLIISINNQSNGDDKEVMGNEIFASKKSFENVVG